MRGFQAGLRPADGLPAGVQRIEYRSRCDGLADWGLAWPGDRAGDWIIHLHGHGSHGDQLFVRPDMRAGWLPWFRELGLGILAPNLRDNAWMSPEAVSDLRDLLGWARAELGALRFYFVSGSMGGTGNLIYASLHPGDATAVVALCPASNPVSYNTWLGANPGGVREEIAGAIRCAYRGDPEAMLEHSALQHAERLTMPLFVSHGDSDDIIPVGQSRELADRLHRSPRFTYVEIPGGDHDSPLHHPEMRVWLEREVRSAAGNTLAF